MGINRYQRGYALIVAIVLTTVMLSFGLALGSVAYKQKVLASESVESQYAFYAADTALECALYADQQRNIFDYATHLNSDPALITSVVQCNDSGTASVSHIVTHGANLLTDLQRLEIGTKACADVMVQKSDTGQTSIYAQGYNVSCDTVSTPGTARFVSRGITSSN